MKMPAKRRFTPPGANSLRKKWNKFFYQSPTGSIDPDLQWKQQNEQMKTNPVYKLVNLSGGGTFIEEFDKGKTSMEQKQKIKEYFDKQIAPIYLCEQVEMVTEDDYQKWHNKQSYLAKTLMARKEEHSHKVRSTTVEFDNQMSKLQNNDDAFSIVSLDTLVAPYKEHAVKWKLDHRGAIGETPLHLLFLMGTEKHIKIAEILLESYPELAVDVYEGFEYYGESCLHFAIIQNNLKAVKILLKTKQVDVHARAHGKFFIPIDIKRGDVKLRKKKFEGYAYYGEYPLSFAASIGNQKIYDMLVEAGCDPKQMDRYGNNVLHLTVIHDQPDMFYYASKHHITKADPDQCNNDNLTPLALAAKLGRKDMFRKILELSSRKYWSYNIVTCSSYPLKSLDTIGPKGETDWNSALMMIIRGRKENHLDMVSDGIVHQLLQEKWTKFGRQKFIRLLVFFSFHCLFLTLAVLFRPNSPTDLRYGTSALDIARYVFELLTVLICCGMVYYSIREIYLESMSGFWQNVTVIPTRLLYLTASILIIACIPFRFTQLYDVEEWLLVFAVPCLWSYFLFFLRNYSLTGPFITMIIRIFTTDMARFAVIYIILIFTSAVGFFYQYEGRNVEPFLTEIGTIMTLFQMSFGEFDYPSILQSKYQALSILMFVVFMIMVHILLLNMLIAMITRTFERIIKQSEKVWKRQWASMVVTMERSHKKTEKTKFQRLYDLNFDAARVTGAGDADITKQARAVSDIRALMVVHHDKTSETQRKKETRLKWQRVSSQAAEGSAAPSRSDTPSVSDAPKQKLQIRNMTGLTAFIRDAPERDDVETRIDYDDSEKDNEDDV